MAPTPVRPWTSTGVWLAVVGPVVPMPSSPLVFEPQVHTVPSEIRASPCDEPAAMAVTWITSLTCTGWTLHGRSFRKPAQEPLAALPSCPLESAPQPQTVPSDFSAKLAYTPPATAVTPPSWRTCAGRAGHC